MNAELWVMWTSQSKSLKNAFWTFWTGIILKRWTKIAHARFGQQHETINRFLWYLATEKIEEQDIVYGQTEN